MTEELRSLGVQISVPIVHWNLHNLDLHRDVCTVLVDTCNAPSMFQYSGGPCISVAFQMEIVCYWLREFMCGVIAE